MACFQEVILVTDADGKILMANKAVEAVLGYAPHELIGRNLSSIFTPEDHEYFYPNLMRLGRKSMPFQGEALLLTKDDDRFFAFLVLRSFHDPTLKQSFIFLSIRDIHAQKQTEKATNETNYEDLVKVANGVAHELRNPLVGIGGFVKRLYDKCSAVQEHAVYYDHIMQNLRKIEIVVKKVEFLAKLPRPSLKMEELKTAVEEGVRPYHAVLEKRGIEVELLLSGIVLKLDRGLISRVFSILTENAVDALRGGGAITVEDAVNDNLCEIEFSDTGPGISTEDLPFIFNPFFSTKTDGAGIDLSIVKRIVESHGGGIRVHSEKGRGATFLLQFPLERRRAIRISRI
jgi:PAS domain S-box-containing protein